MEQIYKESFYNIEIMNQENGKVLIYNSVSNTLAWFNKEVYNSFREKNSIKKEEILSDIIRCGFVVPREKNEYAGLMYEKRMTAYNQQPQYLHYVIAPTMNCNYRCKYCFELNYTNRNRMDDETVQATIDFIKKQVEKAKPSVGVHIQWFGGEPLLALDIIEKISKDLLKWLAEKGLKYLGYIVTNAYFLTEKNVERLLAVQVTGAQITLDGTEKVYNELKGASVDAFERVVDNIIASQNKMAITLRLNTCKENVQDIRNLIWYICKEKGFKGTLYMANIRNYDEFDTISQVEFEKVRADIISDMKADGLFERLYVNMPKRRFVSCEACTNKEFVIGANGNLYRCVHLLDREGYESGNVHIGYEVKEHDMIFFDGCLPLKCSNCKILPLCMGSCMCDREIDHINIDCDAKLMNIKTNIWATMDKDYNKDIGNGFINTKC